ncbi:MULTISPECIES: branched-chain amino acid ABC transporter permease [unclassified Streptomyces]|uniref:branched-chain amino acid ABC transporter permease n=1 Tax=unclassified Streptomyces TaxID=2593676 RepID=UPI00136CACC0|nr:MULTISPECIES: branched-chain amino acid ABC transporter permease [unclassified Streptomyces]MCW5253521.1 branched-chain amino acid ABC transporter permease [Streptomyces sp. SHP 1-2]MYU24075.1 branched-chain amino acid ABC transporter permease [Streptomyces sp. SID8352]
MNFFMSLLISGISVGALYALVALGIVIVYKASSVVNFSQVSFLMLGTYVVASAYTTYDLPFWAALLLGAVFTVLLGLVVERLLIRRFTRTNSVVAASIMTIGLDTAIATEVQRRIGASILPPGDPWGDSLVTVAGITVPQVRVVALVLSLLFLGLFQLWLQRSDFGIAMRATAERPDTAALMGIRLSWVAATAWGLAGLLAVLAGVFLVAFPSPGLDGGVTHLALRALPAAIIGGLRATSGAIVGGVIVGVTESMVLGYHDQLSFLGQGLETVAPYVVMLLVLLWRPNGLFGAKELSRV